MTTPSTVRLLTLGCKVNQYETQYLKETLELNGWREAGDAESPQLCIVNSCTVTHEGDAKTRQLVRRLHSANPQAAIVVMGCYATRDPEAVGKLPGVTRVVTDKQRVLEDFRDFGVTRLPTGIRRFDGHQRAFVKVQDGCLLHCSFCIIPSVRPVVRSRSIAGIVDEVAQLVEGGCPEVVLTGIHLGHYGIDLSRGKSKADWSRLWHLLAALDRLPGDFRVRLSSLEAAEVRGEFVDALAASRRVCPHLHLCLQSGSDRILGLMKRRYRSAGFLERCKRLRQALDKPAFTTDVIVGFPGETETDFAATCRVIEDVGFAKVHIFSYSPRRGTPAADLPDRVSPEVVAERRERLQALEKEQARRYAASLFGRELDVLVEGPDPARPGHVRGTACRYVPVAFEGRAEVLLRRRVPVRAVAFEHGVIVGRPEPLHLASRRISLL
ncbi:MAG: tRNA (N(6)-L-threonylcarbamoyladenosine(37)-C(2))-methylthiotransferase MtaB [Planctomycetia bacterium]|nr:tRNA (N(6)-L-threonylcarbamoyladenosine(37)-C(2))-methylthiotransferase MtaB [Planctomycetia bacterium]